MITLTREEAQQVLDAMSFCAPMGYGPVELYQDSIELLRARLSAPEPVPTGFIRTLVKIHTDGTETWKDEPLYTAPPKREWQSLTDEDLDDAYEAAHKSQSGAVVWSVTKYTEAIEAKLREKNS